MNAKSKKFDGPWRKPTKIVELPRHKRLKEAEKRKKELELVAASVNYEANVPRCANCSHFRKAGQALVNSLPVSVAARCQKHKFKCSAQGCCDSWLGKDGDELII